MSDDVVTLDLYTIHQDPKRLEILHRLQLERAEEETLTGGDRPEGMRLSCPDPVRRVKAALDDWWALTLDEGTMARGHILEDYLEVALFHSDYEPLAGASYESQVPVQWHEHGRSAFDFVTNVNGIDRVVSCKSSIRSTQPTSANRQQERRMLAHAGYAPGSEYETWMIDPGTMRAAGPYIDRLEAMDILDARVELDGVTKAYAYFSAMTQPSKTPQWNDPKFWSESFGLESTSNAFQYDTLDACGAIEARVRRDVRLYEQRRQIDADWKQHNDEVMKPIVAEQIALARLTDPTAKSVKAYGADQVITYTIDSRGALLRRIDAVDETTEQQAA